MKPFDKLRTKYEILEHRADLEIRAFGRTKEELFLNIMIGMEESMRPTLKEEIERTKREIEIKALDLPSLLVDFLNEVLYLVQTGREIYNKIEFSKFTDTEIKAELSGFKVERFGEDIKAATHHNLEIKQDKNNLEVTILFDI
jgi:SHS2 domain-containing protein